MNGFLSATFTRQKFQGLFVNTALGNFAGYLADSLVTLASTHHALERRGISNLFGLRPRRSIVVHTLPQWLEWLLAVVIGFLVMEAVRYWFNRIRYEATLSAAQPELPRVDRSEDHPTGETDCSPTPKAAQQSMSGEAYTN
jgi:hypothetical protein